VLATLAIRESCTWTNNTRTTNAIRREGQDHVCLRNDDNIYIPPARLSQTSRALLMFILSIFRYRKDYDKDLKFHFFKTEDSYQVRKSLLFSLLLKKIFSIFPHFTMSPL
jgi:hypothetical protein